MERIEEARDYYAKIAYGADRDRRKIVDESGEKVYFLFPSTGHFSVWFSKKGLEEEIGKAGLKARIEEKGEVLLAVMDRTG